MSHLDLFVLVFTEAILDQWRVHKQHMRFRGSRKTQIVELRFLQIRIYKYARLHEKLILQDSHKILSRSCEAMHYSCRCLAKSCKI